MINELEKFFLSEKINIDFDTIASIKHLTTDLQSSSEQMIVFYNISKSSKNSVNLFEKRLQKSKAKIIFVTGQYYSKNKKCN